MNILWILDKEFDVALNISARLATIKCLEKKNSIEVITSYRHQKKYDFDINSSLFYLDRINFPLLKTFYLFYQHFRFLRNYKDLHKIHIILINSNSVFLLNKLIKMRARNSFKLVFDIRTLPVETSVFKQKLNELLFKRCLIVSANDFNGVTYISEEMRRFCREKFDLPEHKSEIWGSGVDLGLFKPEQVLKNQDGLKLIYHGSIPGNRGIRNIIEALAQLKDYDIRFFLLGSGGEISELKALARNYGLSGKVTFHDPVPHHEVPKYINQMDTGILPFPDWPGWNTSSPIKLFEYLACGKPVVATRIPAHIKVLGKKKFVFWAEDSSPESLARAIRKAYQRRDCLPAMAKEARALVEDNYSWIKQVAKLENFLASLACHL